MKKLVVDKKYNGKKLNKVILEKIPDIKYSTFCKLLRKKDIKVNGKRVNKDVEVFENDEVLIYIQDDLLKRNKEIETVFEDDNILVINKDAGIEITGDNSLTSIVQELYKEKGCRPMPCHRLDRNTTGLVLYAKNKETLDILLSKFKNHEIEKHYLAWVYGIPKEKHKRLEAYLFKDNKKSMVYISDVFKKGYQKIITTYTILEKRKDNTSILDVEIETGKTHQIRAHLAHIGYPIIGDGKYGKNEINKAFDKKTQMLCSYKLKFNFKNDSGLLEYLRGKEIYLSDISSGMFSYNGIIKFNSVSTVLED